MFQKIEELENRLNTLMEKTILGDLTTKERISKSQEILYLREDLLEADSFEFLTRIENSIIALETL